MFFLFCLVHVPIVGCVLAGYIPAPFKISFCIIFPLFDSFCMMFPCFVICSVALKSPDASRIHITYGLVIGSGRFDSGRGRPTSIGNVHYSPKIEAKQTKPC